MPKSLENFADELLRYGAYKKRCVTDCRLLSTAVMKLRDVVVAKLLKQYFNDSSTRYVNKIRKRVTFEKTYQNNERKSYMLRDQQDTNRTNNRRRRRGWNSDQRRCACMICYDVRQWEIEFLAFGSQRIKKRKKTSTVKIRSPTDCLCD